MEKYHLNFSFLVIYLNVRKTTESQYIGSFFHLTSKFIRLSQIFTLFWRKQPFWCYVSVRKCKVVRSVDVYRNFSNAQQLRISRTDIHVVIDARMDDPVWQEADIASHFMQSFPYDSSEAIAQTEVRMAYDNDF
ncbi:MAG: hypothetical protein ACUZ8O_09635, partial [Candidatus Anammoxibacter sp.]